MFNIKKIICICFLLLNISNAFAFEFTPYTTPNHTKIWHYQTDNLPIVSMNITFPVGSVSDTENLQGLARLAAATMDEGAGEYDSSTFRDILEKYNIALSYSASRQYFTLSLSFMAFDSDIVADLVKLSLSKPRFDDAPVSLMKQQLIAGIENASSNPDEYLSRIAQTYYFKDDIYARPFDGTKSGIQSVTRKDLQKFTKKLAQKGTFVSIVGDISAQKAQSLVTNMLSALPAESDTVSDPLPPYYTDIQSEKIFLPFSIPQTQILYQKNGIFRNNKDFMAYSVASHIFGGSGFSSFLMDELREKNGLTYNAGGYLNYDNHASRFMMSFAVDNKNIQKSLDITNKLVDTVLKQKITQKNLDDARAYLKGYYALQYNTSEQIANLGTALMQDNMPADYPEKRNDLMDKLTVSDIENAIRKLIIPPYQVIVVGGQTPPKGFTVLKKQDIKF